MAHGSQVRRLARGAACAAALASLLARAPLAAAVEIEGLNAPERITLDGRSLQLNGIGVRVATRFLLSANIYVAALYLETPSTSAEQVLASDGRKQIELRYLYAIGEPDMKKAWDYSFERNCPARDCSRSRAEIDAFLALVRAVAPGDAYSYHFAKDGVDILRNGAPLGSVRGGEFSALLLSTWIGAAPPTPELKQSLLRGSAR